MPVLSLVALLISTVSLYLSVRKFWLDRPAAILEKEQNSQLLLVASKTVILWEQIHTIIVVTGTGGTIDPFIKDSISLNGTRLEEALDKALGLNLWDSIVGDTENSILYFVGFLQSLTYASHQTAFNPQDWTAMHIVYGMIRLLDNLQGHKTLKGNSVFDLSNESISNDVRKAAWAYQQN